MEAYHIDHVGSVDGIVFRSRRGHRLGRADGSPPGYRRRHGPEPGLW